MKRPPATAQDVWQAYLPDVPFESLSRMALGKDAPDTPAEHFLVSERIKREADLRLNSRLDRRMQAFQAMGEREQEAVMVDLLGL
jgi:hypothetical protein